MKHFGVITHQDKKKIYISQISPKRKDCQSCRKWCQQLLLLHVEKNTNWGHHGWQHKSLTKISFEVRKSARLHKDLLLELMPKQRVMRDWQSPIITRIFSPPPDWSFCSWPTYRYRNKEFSRTSEETITYQSLPWPYRWCGTKNTRSKEKESCTML